MAFGYFFCETNAARSSSLLASVWALDVIRGTKTDVLHLQAFIEKKTRR